MGSIVAISALLAALFQQVAGYPALYELIHQGCEIPAKMYSGHGAPEENTNITITLKDSAGKEVTSFMPGEVYNVTLPSFENPSGFANAWAHTTGGTLGPADECGCEFKQASGCMNAAYSSGQLPRMSHEFKWTAPDSPDCVTLSIAQSESPAGAFQTNAADICGPGASSSPPAAGGAPPAGSPAAEDMSVSNVPPSAAGGAARRLAAAAVAFLAF